MSQLEVYVAPRFEIDAATRSPCAEPAIVTGELDGVGFRLMLCEDGADLVLVAAQPAVGSPWKEAAGRPRVSAAELTECTSTIRPVP